MLQNLFVVLALSLSFSAPAMAFLSGLEPVPMTADLLCSDPDGFVVIGVQFPSSGQDAKMWLSSRNESAMGFPMEVLDFEVARCPGCFRFEAKFVDSVMKGSANNFQLVVVNHDIGNAGKDETLNMVCAPKN